MRSVELVEYMLKNEQSIPSSTLASHFGVSSRTLRDYIRHTNNSLSGVARIKFSRARNGYVLKVSNQIDLEAWLGRANALASNIEQSPAQTRAAYLLNDLLLRSDWITLDELASILYVSRASISNDLKLIEPALSAFNLKIEKRPHYGIRVVGTEMSRRLCLAQSVVHRVAQDENGTNELERKLIPLMRTLSETVEKVLQREQFSINSFAYQNLLVHLGIALMRIENSSYVPQENVLPFEVSGTREYEVAKQIAQELKTICAFRFLLPR